MAIAILWLTFLCRSFPLSAADPIYDPEPPSTLLPPGSTSIRLSVRTLAPATCAYSLGEALPFNRMTPFEQGEGTWRHETTIQGLDPDPGQLNRVFVRCTCEPDFVLQLKYRSLPTVRPHFPRTGNLWGTRHIYGPNKPLEHAARIDLHLGAGFTPAEILRLRKLNPQVLILTSINTVENSNVPEDYYLRDTEGNKIEVWPGIYRLNLTRKDVAEYQARYAYETMLTLDLMVDGCFFDNFFTTQSWLQTDIHGRKIQLDADRDGRPDDPKWLDAAWREGVFHELRTWRRWMPHAIALGHLPRPADAETMEIFNGDSIGFWTARVLEGSRSFADFWKIYHGWFERGRKPVVMMIESAPHRQISYGYDYSPRKNIPPPTLEFARTYYPYMRFGLAFTLMNDGYFAHEFGDTAHGDDWWYEELNFDLGEPQGPPQRVKPDIELWRRDFANGVVLLNGTRQPQTVELGPGYRRLKGREAARYEYIVDDLAPAFSAPLPWRAVVYDSGLWKSKGPFYHSWGESSHQLDEPGPSAEWKLSIPEDDTYTIAAWWPAAPEMHKWSKRALFEVVSGEQVVAARVLDQSREGDQWHEIASVPLRVADDPVVRLRNLGEGPVVADALWIRSAKRFNDGSPAEQVTLAPMDGIVLERVPSGPVGRYRPSGEHFPNPERGFYVHKTYLARPAEPAPPELDEEELRVWRAAGISLLRIHYVLAAYRDAPLPPEMLARIERDFATARNAGMKVILRFAYNSGSAGEPDAGLERILGHLDQVKPLLHANEDVIAFVEAGFIGTRGEWDSSTHGFFDPNPVPEGRPRLNEQSRAVIDKLLEAVPPGRMIAFRYPQIKMELFGPDPLSESEAYRETPKARLAAHNDCFLGSQTHRGTFTSNIEQERRFYQQDNLFVPQSGETCSADEQARPYLRCENALRELEEFRFTALNIGHHMGALSVWRSEGCFAEIERRLGYRFRLFESEVQLSGEELHLRLRVANQGFANLYNKRPVYVVLRPTTGGEEFRFAVPVDPRWWMPGGVTEVSVSAPLMRTMPQGDYEVLLWLPDASENLRDRPEYAIRFANEGVWEPATGMNRLFHVVSVRF